MFLLLLSHLLCCSASSGDESQMQSQTSWSDVMWHPESHKILLCLQKDRELKHSFFLTLGIKMWICVCSEKKEKTNKQKNPQLAVASVEIYSTSEECSPKSHCCGPLHKLAITHSMNEFGIVHQSKTHQWMLMITVGPACLTYCGMTRGQMQK